MVSEYDRALSALNYLHANCSRDEWLHIAMAAKSAGITLKYFIAWSSNANNYVSEKDCENVWDSIKEGKITKATLFYKAIQEGWRDPYKVNSNSSYGEMPKRRKSVANDYAVSIWEMCVPANETHPYIVKKRGKAEGLRVYSENLPPLEINGKDVRGYLVVPCYSNGKIQILQFISPTDGSKLNLSQCQFNDGFFTVGRITHLAYICESIGNAWAIYQASGIAAVACFSSGRIKTVASVIRYKFPEIDLIIVPDRGKEEAAAAIAHTVRAKWVELPADKHDNYDVNDYAKEYGYELFAELLCTVKAPEMRYKLISGNELMDMPPMRWLIRGILPAEGLASTYGPSMSGKSFLAIDKACAIANGDGYWFGYRVTQANVTYVCLEGEVGLRKRLKAWRQHRNRPIPSGLKFVMQPFNLLTDDIEELGRAIIEINGQNGLAVIDTLSRAAPGSDENSPIDMGRIVASAEKLRRIIGGVVELIHHTGKTADKGPRGHTILFAALDAGIETTKIENPREFKIGKSKDDESGIAHGFNLESIEIGCDEDGESITSCIVAPSNDDNQSRNRFKKPNGKQKIVWDILGELFKASRCYGKGDAPITKACVEYEYAIEQAMASYPCEKHRQKERTKDAISRLVLNGFLKFKDGWLWIPV